MLRGWGRWLGWSRGRRGWEGGLCNGLGERVVDEGERWERAKRGGRVRAGDGGRGMGRKEEEQMLGKTHGE